jgi:hypothetical protein
MVNALGGLHVLASKFMEAVRENYTLETPCQIYSGGHKCFLAMNRCLTPVAESDGIDELPMPANIDPTHRLRDVVGSEYVYTGDNVVLFTEVTGDGDSAGYVT